MLAKKYKNKPFQVRCDEKDLNVYSVKPSDKIKGNSKIYIERKEDLYELIQSYKDSCGLEAMITLLKRGQITAQSLSDDGQHSGDGTIPTELGPAYLAVNETVSNADKLAKALGLTAEDLESQDITEKVRAAISKIVAEQTKEVTENGQ